MRNIILRIWEIHFSWSKKYGLRANCDKRPRPFTGSQLSSYRPPSLEPERGESEGDPKSLKDGAGRGVWGRQGKLEWLPADCLPEKADCDAQIGHRGECIQQVLIPSKEFDLQKGFGRRKEGDLQKEFVSKKESGLKKELGLKNLFGLQNWTKSIKDRLDKTEPNYYSGSA